MLLTVFFLLHFISSKVMKTQYSKLTLLGIIILHVFACYLFYTGFFPVTKHTKINNGKKVRPSSEPVGKYTKLVIMVIDALRSDFVFGETMWLPYMNFTRKLIKDNKTYRARGKPPTVTMPRLKALTSGSESGFSDIMSNAYSSEFQLDNIIAKFKESSKPVIFYGDDTWLKMFPRHFERSEGTTSFFVSDYTEVDDNVTQHLNDELSNNDWNVMILHYLGLDHIGHLAGPYSPLVPPKLQEMDNIIERISSVLHNRSLSNKKEKSLFLICGDHGMSEAGSHGGASSQETQTPFLFISSDYKGVAFQPYRYVNQIDLVSTLALLYDLEIPERNTGQPINEFLQLYQSAEQLNFRKRLACQLHGNSMPLAVDHLELVHSLYNICEGNSVDTAENILNEAATRLQGLSPEYNEYVMLSAISLLIISTMLIYMLISHNEIAPASPLHTPCKIDSYYSKLSERHSMKSLGKLGKELPGTVLNTHVADRHAAAQYYAPPLCYFSSVAHVFSILSIALVLLSSLSSSFMEEEHYVWYYMTSSYFVLFLIINYRKKEFRYSFLTLLFVVVLRLSRSFNQTGVKWISLMDLTHWLVLKENRVVFATMLLLLLVFVFYLKVKSETLIGKLLITIGLLDVVLFKLCNHTVFEVSVDETNVSSNPFTYVIDKFCGDSTSVILPRIAYLIVVLQCVMKMTGYAKYHRSYLIVLVMLLLKLQNIPWFCSIVVMEEIYMNFIVHKLDKMTTHSWHLSHVYFLLIKFTFFSHGNSNSFSTIDIAAGLIGFRDYHPFFASVLSYIATYSSCSYWVTSCLDYSGSSCNKSKTAFKAMHLLLYATVFHIIEGAVLCSIVYMQRYHLFIWSVFAPRLFYYIASMCWYFTLCTLALVIGLLKDCSFNS